MTNATLLDRLANLSAQRTARTDRLHETVQVFLATLAPHVQVGDAIHFNKGLPTHLRLARVDSRRGPTWSFFAPARMRDGNNVFLGACDPTRPIGWTLPIEDVGASPEQGPLRGPRREDLILLAEHASHLVARLVTEREREASDLASAITSGQKAIVSAHSVRAP